MTDRTKQITGLSDEQVIESRRLHGANVLTPPKKDSLWRLLLEKFNDPIIKILMVAWVLSIIIAVTEITAKGYGVLMEPLGILMAILIATIASFVFEWRAERAFERLNTVSDDALCTVIRSGVVVEVPRKDIVVGDVVLLNQGDEVPADGVLLEAVSLQVNESTLTGEPIASKTTDPAHFDSEATYPSNHVMRSSMVADGHGIMRVERVGDATDYGKVYEGAQIDSGVLTPLQQQLGHLASQISRFGYAVAAITFVALTAKAIIAGPVDDVMTLASNILNYFMLAVTVIVVSVPEGLPMSVTLSLALSMNRMLATNNLVRKMHACETMGAATVICTDKTGTLTQNRMKVADSMLFGGLHPDDVLPLGISVNSTANLTIASDGSSAPVGNPTEGALLMWLYNRGIDYRTLRESARVVEQLPFSTERKYMATVVAASDDSKLLLVKGAPEIVMAMCSCVGNAVTPITEKDEEINSALDRYQHRAMRTLAFAYAEIEDSEISTIFAGQKLNTSKLVLQGIVGIADPVRPDVADAIAECHRAGVEVKIVTGDTRGTACEIARQVGIDIDSLPNSVINGSDFQQLPDDEASESAAALKVMCRARPMDKQRLVRLLQQRDEVVAVTGDGTNDAPALKAAQVGISMGDGTSVAKQSSDITIIDNSFANIVKAVMWGRSLYRNIQRFLIFQLTINVSACMLVLIGSLIGAESPLTIPQMLYVNLIMDTLAAVAFATLPPSERVMNDRPRKSTDRIVDSHMGMWVLLCAMLFVGVMTTMLVLMNEDGVLSVHNLTVFFTTFVMLQFWNMFNVKSFRSGGSAFAAMRSSAAFSWIELTILVGLVLIVNFGGEMFSTMPLSLGEWAIIVAATSPVLIVAEAVRLLHRLFHK
ncbi:MAG: calcium-translocating P-type ATPase, PMCA-type [Muribaculaceae bacterium]